MDRFVTTASDNSRGFYEWCNKFVDAKNSRKSIKVTNKDRNNKIKNRILHLIRKILPVSRQAFYDYESKKMMLMEKQIGELEYLSTKINDFNREI